MRHRPRGLLPILACSLTALSIVIIMPVAIAQQTKSAKPKSSTRRVTKPRPYLHAPAVNEYAKHDPSGTTILPEGKLLKPVGRAVPLAQWPHGLAIAPDGKTLFVPSEGVGQTITDWDTTAAQTKELPTGLDEAKKRKPNAGGCVFSPDGKTLFWSGGENGAIYLFDAAARTLIAEVSLNGELAGRKWSDSDAIDIALSADGKFLYCADVTNFRVAVIDVEARKMVG
ncbi:MAG: PD40 domain-containing protein, partial [Fibrella sp.]|nr:PD40 domain-containing protein [Armatimonadota bacterium]